MKFLERILCPILCKAGEKHGIIWQNVVQRCKVWLSPRHFHENRYFSSQFCENSCEELNEGRTDCSVAINRSQTVMWRTDVISTCTRFVKNAWYSRCCVSLHLSVRHTGLVLSVTLGLNFVTDSDVHDPRPKSVTLLFCPQALQIRTSCLCTVVLPYCTVVLPYCTLTVVLPYCTLILLNPKIPRTNHVILSMCGHFPVLFNRRKE